MLQCHTLPQRHCQPLAHRVRLLVCYSHWLLLFERHLQRQLVAEPQHYQQQQL